ncbi:DNA mismatch repair protein MutL [Mollisia scopiformis]|uniref:DNA mismatch repair protein PMS1 n=1 Tax=Mollisia scopiformis TaxID=149040 RepID=A0A132B1T0_MOLSC|nr:DNA mismatch repair protein MutL [Mollisia scopiformis]KUJ06251.1 DNA mismatch repair protein MutL [Mollisia scopiformis]
MATIKAIEGGTVHQIQSGQVIVDLCSVVKELVENSLDAGATSVDVRFKNQGLDAIEVQDNGDGISPHNYETLALKHHTSKLSTYADLTTLQTFGFRGEALSSLCALSKFSVVTCLAADAPKGTRLDFATSGKLTDTSVVAAQKGTTVSVENLFNNLPVRRRELERNIKREWGKVVGVLGQYACIQTGIKFSVSQQAGKGKKTTLFSTKGNSSTRENIVNVFGAKTLTALIGLDLNLELEATSAPSQRWSTQEDGGKKDIRIVGHISRPASSERQTPDRQMFFVNARPCGLPQVAKAFNEVYKSYSGWGSTQSPFIFANIELDTHLYDVNVSPDKRTILLHDQNRMLETLKEELTALFESQDYSVPISQLAAQKQPSYKQLTITRENSAVSRTSQTPARTPARIESESAEVSESEDGSRSGRREQSTDEEGSGKKFNPQFRRGAVSRETMVKNAESLNLISKWTGRKSESRSEQSVEAEKPAQKQGAAVSGGLSDEKRKLVEKLRREAEQKQLAPQPSEDPDSSVATTQSTTAPASAQAPSRMDDTGEDSAQEEPQQDLPDEEPSLFVPEDPVPALQSPPKPTPSLADRFMSTAKLLRAPAEIATITIGDHTVTSSIGTPCPTTKRARIEHVPSTAKHKAPSQVPKGTLPSFGSIFSQRFSAPGTASQPAVDNEEGEGEAIPEPQSPQFIDSDSEENGNVEEDEGAQGEVTEVTEIVVKEEPQDVDSSAIPPDVEDGEVLSEDQKKALEEAKVEAMIQDAENAAVLPSQENVARTKSMLKGGSKKKDSTLNIVRNLEIDAMKIRELFYSHENMLSSYQRATTEKAKDEALDSEKAEEKLSLTISKDDFATMKIVGQFNLGFILASRASQPKDDESISTDDDLFIIDQHASDEKYNFERLQATTIVQSQRLVHPKTLDLTALEEEIVLENLSALETNGFIVTVDESGESPVGKRCQLVSLPISRETAFSVTDLEELIPILAEHPPGTVPRPSKVRKMFAMRACRSSIMIGKTLTQKQMERVVRHLGELDKPWNCPHGRPTMRHLSRLGVWDELGWKEDHDSNNETTGPTDWAAYVRQNRGEETSQEEEILDEIEE